MTDPLQSFMGSARPAVGRHPAVAGAEQRPNTGSAERDPGHVRLDAELHGRLLPDVVADAAVETAAAELAAPVGAGGGAAGGLAAGQALSGRDIQVQG